MAAQYTPGRVLPDIQVTQYGVVDVERCAAETIPSKVFFEVYVPRAAFNPGTVDAIWLAPIAQEIEYLIGSGQAASILYVEEPDPTTGLLDFFFDITVSVPSPSVTQPGPFEATVRVPALSFLERLLIDALVIPAIDAALANLQGVAGL